MNGGKGRRNVQTNEIKKDGRKERKAGMRDRRLHCKKKQDRGMRGWTGVKESENEGHQGKIQDAGLKDERKKTV